MIKKLTVTKGGFMDEEQKDTKHLIVAIAFNETKGTYEMNIPQGSNVPEVAFGIAALCKCLVRDKVIEKPNDFINLIKKYVHDPQYGEVTDGEQQDS